MPFTVLFARFQEILELNNKILDMMADMGDKLGGDYVFDRRYIESSCSRISEHVYRLIYNMHFLAPKKYPKLDESFRRITSEIEAELEGRLVIPESDYVMPYKLITQDFAEVVGGKNANIAEVGNHLGLKVPSGFAITTRAYRSFISHNGLDHEIKEIMAAHSNGRMNLKAASDAIRSMIAAGSIPPMVRRAIEGALVQLAAEYKEGPLRVALRSSAWGEDSEHTFAGQYLSLLNEPVDRVLSAYKEIIESTYSASAMEYRQQKGFMEHEVAMAVACQVMVNADKSGVLYTLDPLNPQVGTMLITAAWGLGAPIVGGEVRADRYTVFRDPPYEVTGLDIVRKSVKLAPKDKGGCEFIEVPSDLQTTPCLSSEEARKIAEAGMLIEKYYRKPQDIEWAMDSNGSLYILQARVLNIKAQVSSLIEDISSQIKQYPVIFSNRGVIAEKGIATGRVHVVKSDEDLDRFPSGAILVARQSSPRFARVIKKASGIITDMGSPTGHMATIAREFRVPTIVGTGIATRMLRPGQEVTIDAEDNVVYEGMIKELIYYEFTGENFEETYEYRLLRRILKKISPLNLLDPFARNFVPEACKTYHDITRFIHEKAVEELINLNYHLHSDPEVPAKKLKSEIPLDLIVIDVGGGYDCPEISKELVFENVTSEPMRWFLEGLNTPGVWSSEPMSVDFGSFMSSMTRTFSSNLAGPRHIGQNLAVISRDYINISLRLGYHFNMIDAYVSENINDNYAYFRFMGGVTDKIRRGRRAKLIAEILSRNRFRVDMRGDLVVARVKKLDRNEMKKKIHVIGQLVAFTRQLDVQMTDDGQINRFLVKFNNVTKNAAITD
ncbi:MAG: pyruvate, water dikinase [Deltaproteobacteria bacterium]|nr:pyruvate, water dikinase [Deltaproteobacteria bacterium]